MHRQVGTSDIYAVFNLPKGTECFFRSKGKAELWNPWTGERRPLFANRVSKDGTTLRLPLSSGEVQLIVFTPGDGEFTVEQSTLSAVDSITVAGEDLLLWGEQRVEGRAEALVTHKGKKHRLAGDLGPIPAARLLTGEWEFEVRPTLDNRWGDFHWPPTPELIGPEVRRLSYQTTLRQHDLSGTKAHDTVSCSFGEQFWKLGPLPGIVPDDSLPDIRMFHPQKAVTFNGKTYAWHPYQFSWRWGVEDDPGHQGYHGLKEEVHDEFIRLGKMVQSWTSTERQAEEGGTYYCLTTGVHAPYKGTYVIEHGRTRPVAIRINGRSVDTTAQFAELNAGVNTVLLWYDKPCATYFVLRKSGEKEVPQRERSGDPAGKPLTSRWYGDTSILSFDARFVEAKPEGWYYFTSAPGMKRMQIVAHGALEVFVAGERVDARRGVMQSEGAIEHDVDFGRVVARPVEVAVHIEHKRGYYGGAAIPEPIRLQCEKGVLEIGDWSRNDGLYAYSGGAWYRTAMHLNPEETQQRVELDLGSVVSTAEVWVNGKHAGLKVSPPWVFDISPAVREGENSIEVLVYNTAANHYTSIPTRYRGSIVSGILGPVTLSFSGRVVMKEQ